MAPTALNTKEVTIASTLDIESLRAHTHWIRDTIDPIIARDGPEAMSIEDALYADQFLRKLLLATVTTQEMRISRIHLALIDISGRSTRWPHRLIERAEAVIKVWEAKVGKLGNIGVELLGPGGRLEGIATMSDIASDTLITSWLKQGNKVLPMRARKHGDLGFKPGDWWINALFAFRAGIIDSGDPDGGIVSDGHSAYAILLTNGDEIASTSPESFTYRSSIKDKGRYRLTSAAREVRQPVRILRSHTLRSVWSPRAGVRYDGLYKVTSWSIHQEKTKTIIYDIDFVRVDGQESMEVALARPTTEEIDDYKEFKRLKHTATTAPAKPPKLVKMGIPTFLLTEDGLQKQV